MIHESLESRTMMSVAASVGAGTLYVYGDDANNGLSIERSGGDVVVKQYSDGSYKEFYRTAQSNVQTIKIWGRAGDDTITIGEGVKGDATINGEAGKDWMMSRGTGKATIFGHSSSGGGDDNAADTIVAGQYGLGQYFGQGGDDMLFGGLKGQSHYLDGMDKYFGGNGNDRFFLGAGVRIMEIRGEAGHDRLQADYVRKLTLIEGPGFDTVDFSAFGSSAFISLAGGNSGSLGIRLMSLAADGVVGSKYADQIVGDKRDNVIYGLAGNDTISGKNGDDSLYGGDGDDSIVGDAGNDLLVGENGSDKLNAEDGFGLNDMVWGGLKGQADSAWFDLARVDQQKSIFSDVVMNVDQVL